MPSLTKVLLALTALSAVLGSSQPGRSPVHRRLPAPLTDILQVPDCAVDTGSEICPPSGTPISREIGSSARELIPSSVSNAERLARRLPLKAPSRRSSAHRARYSSTPPSPQITGYIQVLSLGDSSSVLGYVSKNSLSGSGHYAYTASLDNALLVGVSGDGTTSGNIVTLNSDYPSPSFLGLVQGRDSTSSDLATGSFNYLYLASTAPTDPGASPQDVGSKSGTIPRTSESSVWTIDPVTSALTAQWINTDDTPAPTISFTQSTGIYFGGDPDAFHAKYPSPIQTIALTFIKQNP
ncbi:hypothetical protein DFH09DRAFT_1120331 [Mycena vulgaris]|nr:hypothetical protein DFH09DRAFT_1120331 [Mycena vulgaris]